METPNSTCEEKLIYFIQKYEELLECAEEIKSRTGIVSQILKRVEEEYNLRLKEAETLLLKIFYSPNIEINSLGKLCNKIALPNEDYKQLEAYIKEHQATMPELEEVLCLDQNT